MKKRILIGLAEIASVIRDLGIAFRNEGYCADTVIAESNFYYKNYQYTFDLTKNKLLNRIHLASKALNCLVKSIFFISAFGKYDYFVYVWSYTFMPARLDQFILKLAGKPFCILYCGSELRQRSIALKCEENKFGIRRFSESDRAKYLSDPNQTGIKDFFAKAVRSSVSNFLTKNIFSSRCVSTLTLKPFYNEFQPIFLQFSGVIEKSNHLTIVHAPSNSLIKNSAFIICAVEELKNEGYDFDFVLLRKQPNEVVLSALAKSHIAIDQIASLPGRFAMEAMALGCAVLGGNKHYYEQQCDEIPVIDITLDKVDLKNKIIYLLKNPIKINELGAKGRLYIEKYHNGHKTVSSIISALEGRTQPDQTPAWDSKEELLSYCDHWYEKALIKILVHK
jgi:hypothetical protein